MNGEGSAIDIGLIGFGSWARKAYVPALLEHPDVRVKAVAARTESTLDAAREALGPQMDLFTDYRKLLDRPDIGAVMIGLPRPANASAALYAVRGRKHLWVEPPFELGPAADQLLEEATASTGVFHADLELRYLPVVEALFQLAVGDELGTPNRVRVELANDWARERVEAGSHMGTVVAGLATWYVDLIDVFFPESPVEIALEGDLGMAVGTATVRYMNGRMGEFAFNLAGGPEWRLRLRIAGDGGEAEADLLTGAYRHRRAGGDWRDASADCARPAYGFVGMRESVAAFLSAVLGEKRTLSGPDTYARVHRVLGEIGRQTSPH